MFLYFCLVLFYFFFSIVPIFEIVSKEKAVFRKEKKTATEAIYSIIQNFFCFCFCWFYSRNSTSTRGRNRRESRQIEEASRSMDVSMYARTYDALHFRYSRPL